MCFISRLPRFIKELRLVPFGSSDHDHAAAKQRTPFNTNRYALLLIYVVYTFLSSCTYFGWRNLSHMLIKSGAYAWLCEVGDGDLGDKRFLCDKQDTHVQKLFTIAMACHFIMSACAGALIDIIGPKLTATFGQILNTVGWLLLAFSSDSFRAYIPAFVFIGAGADTGFLPTLSLANVFPGSTALCIAILGSAVSASFSIPLVLDTIWSTNIHLNFFSLCIGYLFCGPVLCALLALLFLPWKSFTGADAMIMLSKDTTQSGGNFDSHLETRRGGNRDDQSERQNEINEYDDHNAKVFDLPTSESKSGIVMNFDEAESKLYRNIKYNHQSNIEKSSLQGNSLIVNNTDHDNKIDIPVDCIIKLEAESMSEDFVGEPVYGMATEEVSTDAITNSPGSSNCEEDVNKVKWISSLTNMIKNVNNCKETNMIENGNKCKNIKQETRLLKLLLSDLYLFICLYFIACSLAMAYYQEAAGRLFSTTVEATLAMLVPFSFIPCIIIGKTIDLFGIMPIILFVNAVGLLTYMFACFHATALHYMSTVAYTIYISVYTSQLYCYINDTFASQHFGKLLGFASCAGGCLSLTTHLLYEYVTVDALHGNTLLMNIVFVCCLALLTPMLVFMMFKKRKMRGSTFDATEFKHAA